MNAFLATTLLAASVAAVSVPARDVDVAQVYEDVRVIRRVASVSGSDLPEKLLYQLIDENVERLRGRVDERNYSFASWTRSEHNRVTDTVTVKKEKDGRSTIAEIEAPSAYRLVIGAPTRRYIAARNRPLQLDSVIVEYNNAAGFSKTEQFDIHKTLNPGEETSVDLAELGWNVRARLKATASEKAMRNATVELALLAPTLVDDDESPFAMPTVNMLAMRTAVANRDILEIRRLCDATTGFFDERSRKARSQVRPVGNGDLPSLDRSRLLGELQRVEDLLTGDVQQRRAGMDKLHQLIVFLRP